MPFPSINPVALQLGPLIIRWYSLAYVTGIVAGWFYIRWMNRRQPIANLTAKAFDDMILWAVLGVVGGGRIGYVLFYKPDYYLENPLHIFTLWEGGMSFHGGLIGVIVAMWFFCRKFSIPYLSLMDPVAAAAPIGLFLGRLANFVNGELYGRVTDSPLGMIFPRGGDLPRHPSQLYEAALEGVLMFTVCFLLVRYTRALTRPGLVGGAFLSGYGLCRAFAEFFREPDVQLGYLFGVITMGQLLCLPMIAIGSWLIFRAKSRAAQPTA